MINYDSRLESKNSIPRQNQQILHINSIAAFTQLSSSHDHIPNRRVSDNFSAPRSYTPEYHTQTTYLAQHRLCEQLREEAKHHQTTDTLVMGFSSPRDNPFRDKQKCSLL
ncbi:unnamed protein product [Adineta ricciae]|uniref:G protein gamma domain-containing protein n=1 Tax=Adineta ricciae TaxID=249248 RepID=A0A814YRH9_ADIRI|nr:unnamed protein product [Adineta ricciae]